MKKFSISDNPKNAGAIKGLQLGKVMQLQDPEAQNRILVRIPGIDNNAPGIWARVASIDAGNQRGAFFLPEIGDDVIVGFIDDNPLDAVVLGMFNNSKKPAPITAQNSNDKKGFTTRSKLHLMFNDNTKTIIIDTPAGNSIIMDEQSKKIEIKDQNQNIITMDASGIQMKSAKNIDIKAGANLTLNGTNLTLNGVSLSLKADADVTVQGAAAKITSSGVTEVRGSIVKIN